MSEKKERESKEVVRSASGLKILFTVGPFFRSLYGHPLIVHAQKFATAERSTQIKIEQIAKVFFLISKILRESWRKIKSLI